MTQKLFRSTVQLTYIMALGLLIASAASASPTFSWQGTAPSCDAGPGDCTGATPHYWSNNHSGDGAPCWTGHKVLCSSVPASDYQNLVWIGTAPFCDGKPSDCTDRGLEFLVQGTSGDGQECDNGGLFHGHKVLCGKRAPSNPPIDISNASVVDQPSATADCPTTCSGQTWNGQFSPLRTDVMVCGTYSGHDIPVGYFNGQRGADATCPARIAQMRWNGQWNQGICGCQPATLIPPPAFESKSTAH